MLALSKENQKKYIINPTFFFVADKDSVKFHVENNDYFGTIATIVSAVNQKLPKIKSKDLKIIRKSLEHLEDDLLLLQKEYKITKD